MSPIIKFINNIVKYGLERYSRYYSKYRGFVADVDDPLNLSRVKVIVPSIYGENVYNYWAYPSNFSGPGYGIQCLPKVGDLIWVEFEMGDPKVPLWSFGHFTKGQNEQSDKNLYYFYSPGGHKVEIDDTNNIIRITRKGGKTIEIGDYISIGKPEKSDESAVLGETLETLLKDLNDILKNGKILTQAGPQPFMSDTQIKLKEWGERIENIKSKTITLDK